MLRTEKEHNGQIKFFDNWIPKEFTQLSEELEKVDKLLDDGRFYEPIRDKIKKENKSSFRGRPTIPIDSYIRMMYLKFSRKLSYRTLVEEVGDSFCWRKFCHFDLTDKIPDMSTLKKLTKRFGAEAIKEINEALISATKEKKIIRGKKMRTDTTAVESNIRYPTDAGLISDAVRVITRTVKKIQKAGGATRAKFRDRSRSVRKSILYISKIAKRRTGEARKEILKEVTRLVTIFENVVERGRLVYRNSRAKAQSDRFIQGQRDYLSEMIYRGEEIVKQAKRVLSGDVHIPGRKVSVFEPNASVIKKDKPGKKVEFGRKTVITETDHGVISHYDVLEGNPSDKGLLIPELDYHISIFGRPPEELSTDRGYYTAENERSARERGVKRVSMPKPGKKSKSRKEYESQYWFKRLQRFRAGSEAKISLLKRKHSMRRSLSRGWEGAETSWIGWSVLACNLWVIAKHV